MSTLYRDIQENTLQSREMYSSTYGTLTKKQCDIDTFRNTIKYHTGEYAEIYMRQKISQNKEINQPIKIKKEEINKQEYKPQELIENNDKKNEIQNKEINQKIRPKQFTDEKIPLSSILSNTQNNKNDENREKIQQSRRRKKKDTRWYPPWKQNRVIAGHQGWVHSITVDPTNEWFVTGSADRTIKIWDLASGIQKLTLTGHVATVRSVVISTKHPYLFSGSEDREVKCWDLECNKMIRNYHGHLSGIYTVQVHPELDLVFSGGRDSSIRVWDMRTKQCLRTLVGHRHTVTTLAIQGTEPQILSGSQDTMIRLWDLRSSKTLQTLTHHKKSVRSIYIHPQYNSFISASTDNIKLWKLPEGIFMRNAHHNHEEIVNEVCVNIDGVLAAGTDTGNLELFDWYSGHCFQILRTPPQPGSLVSESGIFGVTFDQSGSRLLTCEADKTIKVYGEVCVYMFCLSIYLYIYISIYLYIHIFVQDEKATPETHPITLHNLEVNQPASFYRRTTTIK